MGLHTPRLREKVQQAALVHALHTYVVLVDNSAGHVQLELLQAHDFLLQGVAGQKAIHVDCTLLAKAMCPVHGLQAVGTALKAGSLSKAWVQVWPETFGLVLALSCWLTNR